MSERTKLVERTADYVGHALIVEEMRDGWPALVTLGYADPIPAALHVARVGLSHRDRDDVERRFQNPGSNRPVERVAGRFPLIVGVWDGDKEQPSNRPVLVLADANRRLGHVTRVSIFVPLETILDAERSGWASHISDTNEQILCFWPDLLPAAAALAIAQVSPDEPTIRVAIDEVRLAKDGSGPENSTEVRTRRAVDTLVRDAYFRGRVLDAYGRCCAMCGLGMSLVEGAHILPVSAPGSLDTTSNGVALCANHHRAFDRHQLAIDPDTLDIVFHPEILEHARQNEPARKFLEATYLRLSPTERGIGEVDPEMLRRRYEHFAAEYGWFQG